MKKTYDKSVEFAVLSYDAVNEVLGLDGIADVEGHSLAASSQESDFFRCVLELANLSSGNDH